MPRFAKELPPSADRFKTATSITPGETAMMRGQIEKVGDRYLAMIYTELPTFAKMSILADMLENEIVDRFVEQNMMVPELVDDLVPTV